MNRIIVIGKRTVDKVKFINNVFQFQDDDEQLESSSQSGVVLSRELSTKYYNIPIQVFIDECDDIRVWINELMDLEMRELRDELQAIVILDIDEDNEYEDEIDKFYDLLSKEHLEMDNNDDIQWDGEVIVINGVDDDNIRECQSMINGIVWREREPLSDKLDKDTTIDTIVNQITTLKSQHRSMTTDEVHQHVTSVVDQLLKQ